MKQIDQMPSPLNLGRDGLERKRRKQAEGANRNAKSYRDKIEVTELR